MTRNTPPGGYRRCISAMQVLHRLGAVLAHLPVKHTEQDRKELGVPTTHKIEDANLFARPSESQMVRLCDRKKQNAPANCEGVI